MGNDLSWSCKISYPRGYGNPCLANDCIWLSLVSTTRGYGNPCLASGLALVNSAWLLPWLLLSVRFLSMILDPWLLTFLGGRYFDPGNSCLVRKALSSMLKHEAWRFKSLAKAYFYWRFRTPPQVFFWLGQPNKMRIQPVMCCKPNICGKKVRIRNNLYFFITRWQLLFDVSLGSSSQYAN